MSATKKGTRWEILHSLWIGWTFTLGFFNWIAFLYIGLRVDRKRWLLWGVFYSIPFILAMSLPDLNGWPGDLVVALTFIMGAMGIVHAFLIRKDYLSRLAKRQDERGTNRKLLRESSGGQLSTTNQEVQGQRVSNEGFEHELASKYETPLPSKEDSLLPSEELSKICVKYLADGYYVGETIPEKKLNNAQAHFPIPGTERVVALIDCTAFGSNKLGLAICEGGIYWRNSWTTKTNRTFLSWDEFSVSEPVGEEKQYKAIKLAEGGLFELSASPFKKAEAIALLHELQTLAKNVTKQDGITEQPPHTVQEKGEVRQNEEREATNPTAASHRVEFTTKDEGSSDPPILGRVPRNYPLPLSYSYRLVEAEVEPLRILKETYRSAEGLIAFLASMSLALLENPTSKVKSRLKTRGATFGSWYVTFRDTASLLDERKGALYISIKELLGKEENTAFAQNMKWLIDRRNDFHHRDLPVGKETDLLIGEARRRLEECIQETSILFDYHSLRLVLDYDAVRNSEKMIVTCLDYSGDHPAGRKVKEECVGAPKKQDLYVLQNGEDWISLYPFISIQYCRHCSARETYFIEVWRGEEANLISFERAHEETSEEVGKDLTSLLETKS